MFDKLIVCEPEGADFKNRSRYFMVSTLVVGVFFATADVFSIYAAEVGLGNRDFELVSMLAPPEMVTEPEQIQRQQPKLLMKKGFIGGALMIRLIPSDFYLLNFIKVQL